ncbi:MAG: HEAT repeat domain-containing protein [Armatimonadota bacterium]
MAKMSLEEKLMAVAALEREAPAPGSTDAWRIWLDDPSNIVVARVAEIIGRQGLTAYLPALRDIFHRLVTHPQPASVDKLCRAKEAIITALEALDNPDADPYLRGVHFVQREPVYGGHVDAAAALRGACAIALARMRYAEAAFELTPLLFDPEQAPRIAAIRALTYLGGEVGELLLRMKALSGEANPEVVEACFAGLLALEPDRSLPFVAGFLRSADSQYAEQAALAIGNSRLDAAFPVLQACWEANTDLHLRKPLLLAIALTRREEAFDYLLSLMRDEGGSVALFACDSLVIYGVDARYRERIAAVVTACRNPKLSDAFTSHFPPGP